MSFLKGVGKVFKKVAKVGKKLIIPALAIAAIALTAGMALPVIGTLASISASLGPVLGAVATGAIQGLASGAALGAIKGGVTGTGVLKGATKGGIMGAVTGGAIGGIGAAFSPAAAVAPATSAATGAPTSSLVSGASDVANAAAGSGISSFGAASSGIAPLNLATGVANTGVGSVGTGLMGVGSVGGSLSGVGSSLAAPLSVAQPLSTSLIGASTSGYTPISFASGVNDAVNAVGSGVSGGGGLLGKGGLLGTGATLGDVGPALIKTGGELVSGWAAGKAKEKELESTEALKRVDYDRSAYNYGYENFYQPDKKGNIDAGALPAEQRKIYDYGAYGGTPATPTPFQFAPAPDPSQWVEQPYYQIQNGKVVLVRPGQTPGPA